MKNSEEIKRKMLDAEDCLQLAKKAFADGMYRGSLQNSQSCVELCAKAVISVFEEPDWTHDPSDQLKRVLENQQEKIKGEVFQNLIQLAQDAHLLAPWHGKTLYGQNTANGWIAAVDLCTQDKAEWALKLAKRGFEVTKEFLVRWFGN